VNSVLITNNNHPIKRTVRKKFNQVKKVFSSPPGEIKITQK
jgi:hypothetical protein